MLTRSRSWRGGHITALLVVAVACKQVSVPRLAAQATERTDLIENGGFEAGMSGWIPAPEHAILRDGKASHAGEACLVGEVTAPSKALQLRRRVKVRSTSLYEFQIWARATKRTKLVLWVLPPGTKERRMISSWENVPGRWRRYSAPISVARDGELELQVISPSSYGAPPGKMWIDDIALHETSMPTLASVTNDDSHDDEPALAVAGDDSIYVAWTSFRDGNDSIRAARYRMTDGDSPEKTGEWGVVGGKGTYVLGPAVVAAGANAYLVHAAEVGETNWEIFATPLSPSGPGSSVNVSRADGIDIKPSAVWVGDTLWVVWESNADGGRTVRAASVKGGHVSDVVPLTDPGGSAYGPSASAMESGEVAVAWHGFRSHNCDIFLRRRSPAGQWGEEARLTRAPMVDRHARLFSNGRELWIAYENAEVKGYRVGASSNRKLVVVRVSADNRLQTPDSPTPAPFPGGCEAASPLLARDGRVWVAHLRQRGRRGGWGAFLTGFTGATWTRPKRLSANPGFDRRPAMGLVGNHAIIACQNMPSLSAYANEEASRGVQSNIVLATVDLADLPAPTPATYRPLKESVKEFEAAQIRRDRGDDRPEVRTITFRGQTLRLVYGDLHEHTDVSQCNRLGDQSIDESYQHMRDIVSLDFAAVTDHGYNITPYLWNYTAKMARVNNDPGRFVTFLGEEWTSTFEKYSDKHPYGFYGHRNLILADAYFPRWWNARNRQTPAELWSDLRKMNADFVNIPHQLADTGNVPTDWSFADEEAQPVAEILQVRGSYEHNGAPRQAQKATADGYFLQDAWARGTVIGVIASPDHGGGIGKACVYTPDLDRKSILAALRARHCFGSTASRVFLDVRVNGAMMGEKIGLADGRPVTVEVTAECPAPIDRIEICRNNEFIYSRNPDGTADSFTFTDPNPPAERSYYYVRLVQTDDEIAWSSPVWLGFP